MLYYSDISQIGYNSLVIAGKYHPLPILTEALHLLCPSATLVVYCEYMEPLVECYRFLNQKNLAIKLQITETWKREFQTLPGRMHPLMSIPASGGYLLRGIYVGIAFHDELNMTSQLLDNSSHDYPSKRICLEKMMDSL